MTGRALWKDNIMDAPSFSIVSAHYTLDPLASVLSRFRGVQSLQTLAAKAVLEVCSSVCTVTLKSFGDWRGHQESGLLRWQ